RRPSRRPRPRSGPLHRTAFPRRVRVRHRARPRRRRYPIQAGARAGGDEMSEPRVVPTDAPPSQPAKLVRDFTPELIDVGTHHLCPGCGEPVAMRAAVEAIEELGLTQRTIGVFGIGCYTAF